MDLDGSTVQHPAAATRGPSDLPATEGGENLHYEITFTSDKLGFKLLQTQNREPPFPEVHSTNRPDGLPRPKEKLISVAGASLADFAGVSEGTAAQAMYRKAIELIKGSPRPLVLGFQRCPATAAPAFADGPPPEVDQVLAALKDSDASVRKAALEALGRLNAASLEPHAAAIAAMLMESDMGTGAVEKSWMRDQPQSVAVLAALGKLGVAAPIFATLDHSDVDVRKAAVAALGMLDASSLATHASAIVGTLQDEHWMVRDAALETLAKLDTQSLATNAPAILVALDHSKTGVRRAAATALGMLDAETLATHAPALVAMFELSDGNVGERRAALEALGNLDALSFAAHAPAVEALLDDSSAGLRKSAVETLGPWLCKLDDADALAVHVPIFAAKLDDPNAVVSKAALEALGKLDSSVALLHVPAKFHAQLEGAVQSAAAGQ